MPDCARPDRTVPPARETRYARRGEMREKEFLSRVPPAEQAAPQCPRLIAHFRFVSAYRFSGFHDHNSSAAAACFCTRFDSNNDGRNGGGNQQTSRGSQRIGADDGAKTSRKD